MTIKFARFVDINGGLRMIKDEFETEEEVMDWIYEKLKEFKIRNNIQNESDTSFIRYKMGLMDAAAIQITEKIGDLKGCRKCPEEDHEGKSIRACRCERRNIRIARYKRLKSKELKCCT